MSKTTNETAIQIILAQMKQEKIQDVEAAVNALLKLQDVEGFLVQFKSLSDRVTTIEQKLAMAQPVERARITGIKAL